MWQRQAWRSVGRTRLREGRVGDVANLLSEGREMSEPVPVGHTPTPWAVEGDLDEGIYITGPDRNASVICDIVTRNAGDDIVTPEDEANAEIIVRAVNSHADLLEQLEVAVELFDSDTDATTPGTAAWVWLYAARDAIAKAKGRQ